MRLERLQQSGPRHEQVYRIIRGFKDGYLSNCWSRIAQSDSSSVEKETDRPLARAVKTASALPPRF